MVSPHAVGLLAEAIRLHASGDAPRAVGAIRIALLLSGGDGFSRTVNELERVLRAQKYSDTSVLKSRQSIEETLAISNPKSQRAEYWALLSRCLAGFGFLGASALARSHARTLDIEGARGLAMQARAILDLDLEDIDSNQLREVLQGADHDSRLLASLVNLRGEFPSGESSPIHNLIGMKSVALVGAAVLRGQLGQEIDSHDAVARLKFFGAAFLQPVDEAGKRTDIAFYNKAMSRELNLVLADSRSHHRRQVDTLKFLISKKALPDRRYVKLKTAPTYLTPASLGNSAIFHVLLARPSTLKVYGFDLYTGGVAHSPSDFNETLLAARGLKRDQLHYRLSFFQHNPISQIRFIRNLRRAGRLSASRQVLDVLELTDELYARRLENRFGLGSDVV